MVTQSKMVHLDLQLVIVVCLLLRSCLSSTCNTTDISPCKCSYLYTEDYHKIKVDCTGQELESVPLNLPKDMEILDFTDNYLGYGDLSTLCEYSRLEHVSIAKNHITTIEQDDFSNCEISQSLNFTGNSFNSVNGNNLSGLQFTRTFYGLEANYFTEDAFSDMLMLVELEMMSNQNELPPTIFNSTKLQVLKLEMPNAIMMPETLLNPLELTLSEFELKSALLKTLPENIFSNLTVLQNVTLCLPHLRSMPSRLFQVGTLPMTLKYVTLYDIKYLTSHTFESLRYLCCLAIHGSVEIPPDVFHGLYELEILDLRDLTLEKLPINWFKDLGNLTTLTMRNTDITHISLQDFEYLYSLEILDISKNRLRSLETELFYDISDSLLSLNLSHNNFKGIPDRLFTINAALETLDWSENQISSISMSAFKALTRLKWLHLQNNKIYSVEPDMFAYNVNLFYLDLSSNVLIDLPAELFRNLQSLSVLKLSDNKFSNLERSINFNISSLNELDLSFNPILCDCGTVDIINPLKYMHINGVCEKGSTEISIVEFVKTDCVNHSLTATNVFLPEPVANSELNVIEVTSVPFSKSLEESTVLNRSLDSQTQVVSPTVNLSSENVPTTQPVPLNGSDVTTSSPFKSSVGTITEKSTNNVLHSLNGVTTGLYNATDIGITITPNTSNALNSVSTGLYNATDIGITITPNRSNALNGVTTGLYNATDIGITITPYRSSDHNMSDDVVKTDSTSEIDLNSTGIQIVTSLNRVTPNPNKVESDNHSDGFYISLGSILSVAVLSFLILVYLYYKKRRSRRYEIPRMARFGIEGDAFIQPSNNDDRVVSGPSMTPLKEVPSIQIECVDDDGNIRVELYSMSQTKCTKNLHTEDNS